MALFRAHITVMPLDALLDPQGKAVEKGLQHLGLNALTEVRIGKSIRLELEAESETKATEMVQEACEKLLHNKVMEQFRFELEALQGDR